MKVEKTTRLYTNLGYDENHTDVNKTVKAVIINFGDNRGDIIIENDNFGTNRKYADFTKGKEKAGLHPLQIVFSGIDIAHETRQTYINQNNEICVF